MRNLFWREILWRCRCHMHGDIFGERLFFVAACNFDDSDDFSSLVGVDTQRFVLAFRQDQHAAYLDVLADRLDDESRGTGRSS